MFFQRGLFGIKHATINKSIKKNEENMEVSIMAKVNLSLQVLPVVPDSEIYYVVDQVIEMISQTGLGYVVGPFETSIEGELDELLGDCQSGRSRSASNMGPSEWFQS